MQPDDGKSARGRGPQGRSPDIRNCHILARELPESGDHLTARSHNCRGLVPVEFLDHCDCQRSRKLRKTLGRSRQYLYTDQSGNVCRGWHVCHKLSGSEACVA
ncbi:MAG: hypothetical protein ACAF42_05585 [Limnothrix sp. BL-A-16]